MARPEFISVRNEAGFLEVLETELSCTICTEVVIEPTVVQCGHVFCFHCIIVWMQQSNHSCPYCRNRIISTARVRTWDTFLSRTYNLLPEENRQNRERILMNEAWAARQASPRMQDQEISSESGDEFGDFYRRSGRRLIVSASEVLPVERPVLLYQRDPRPLEEDRRRRTVTAAARNREHRRELGRTPRRYPRALMNNNAMEVSHPESSNAGPSMPVSQIAVVNESPLMNEADFQAIMVHFDLPNPDDESAASGPSETLQWELESSSATSPSVSRAIIHF